MGVSAHLLLLVLAINGCYYFGPADPWDEDPDNPDDVEIRGCDPERNLVLVLVDRHRSVHFNCDVTGAEKITWLLAGANDEERRVVATGVPSLELTGDMLPWEPGDNGEDGFLKLDAYSDEDDPVAAESSWWWLRLLESAP